MNHKFQRLTTCFLMNSALLILASCVNDTVPERVAESMDNIVGGTLVNDPEVHGHVHIRQKAGKSGGFQGIGSGTLLSNTITLTAAHILNESNCPEVNGIQGNLTNNYAFRPDSHTVFLGNNLDPAAVPNKHGVRISVHPRYTPTASSFAPLGVDVAMIWVASPFTVNGSTNMHSRPISPTPASLLVGMDLECFGYGGETQNGGYGFLRQGKLHVASANAPPRLAVDDTAGAMFLTGDSGGPCFDAGGVVAMMHRGDEQNFPPKLGQAISSESFSTWAILVAQSIVDANVLLDYDTIPDSVMLTKIGNDVYIVATGSASPLCQMGCSVFLGSIPPLTKASLVAGDFNDDGADDPVGQLDGFPFYFATDPLNIGNFLDTNGFFTFLPNAYDSFAVGDFDEDGIADLEARDTASGLVDLYFGEQGIGLQSGKPLSFFPSGTGEDGRFTTVSGTGNSTVNFTRSSFFIEVPPEEGRIDVQVFDGDQAGAYDIGDEKTCFRLYATPMEEMTGGTKLVATLTGAQLADRKWSNIYSDDVDIEAKMPGGAYRYRLDVELVDGTCDNPLPHTGRGVNSFSVRTTGQIWAASEKYSLIGWDTIGDHVPPSLGDFVATDTSYDGTWPFWVDYDTPATDVFFREADADELLDELDDELDDDMPDEESLLPGTSVTSMRTLGLHPRCKHVNTNRLRTPLVSA